ncbi:hypothetical protein ACJJI5_09025 [Microbulbifer sp. EKSA008]|uniref:hypothetical protein n=1 Tax=Microbulbifer sp. EKSA008 TaxID=3243367 RepID=UPI0040416BC3
MKSKSWLLLTFFLARAIEVNAEQMASCNDPILEVDFDGVVVAGSKKELSRVALSGVPMRVGWDLDFNGDKKSDLTHWSDAQFTTVMSGEVATKVQSVHRQIPRVNDTRIELSSEFGRWHGLLDSRGILLGRFEHSNRVDSDRVHSVWCFTTPPKRNWEVAFQKDHSGRVVAGGISNLLDAIRRRLAVRISWLGSVNTETEKRTVIEAEQAIPVVAHISNGGEITAQLPHHLGSDEFSKLGMVPPTSNSVVWGAKLSSSGELDVIWLDTESGEISRQQTNYIDITWFIEKPVY